MIQESIHECCLILAPFNTVLRLIQTPSSITTPGPIVTFGPWKDIIKNISAFKSLITYHAVGSNFGSWVDNDISNKTWPFRQQRAVLLAQWCEVETHSYEVRKSSYVIISESIGSCQQLSLPVRKSAGWPTSIQNPWSSIQYNSPSSACRGKTSFSILVGLISILKCSNSRLKQDFVD